jgi:hypothetical protein
MDEITNYQGRYIANIIFETLEIDKLGQIYILNPEILDDY